MRELLKVLAKHKKLVLTTCIVILIAPFPFMLGIIGIIWIMKLLNDVK